MDETAVTRFSSHPRETMHFYVANIGTQPAEIRFFRPKTQNYRSVLVERGNGERKTNNPVVGGGLSGQALTANFVVGGGLGEQAVPAKDPNLHQILV